MNEKEFIIWLDGFLAALNAKADDIESKIDLIIKKLDQVQGKDKKQLLKD